MWETTDRRRQNLTEYASLAHFKDSGPVARNYTLPLPFEVLERNLCCLITFFYEEKLSYYTSSSNTLPVLLGRKVCRFITFFSRKKSV